MVLHSINNVASQVYFRHAVVQLDVDFLVLLKLFVERVFVQDGVWRVTQDSRDVGEQFHAPAMMLQFACRAGDELVEKSDHVHSIDGFGRESLDVTTWCTHDSPGE